MNRRNLISIFALAIMVPSILIARPPKNKPESRGFDGRTPSFGPPSRIRSPQGRPSPDRDSRYKEIMSKFDKNKDGKLDEKERDEAKKYVMSRYRNYKK